MKKIVVNAVFYGALLSLVFLVTNKASYAAALYTGDPLVLTMGERLALFGVFPLWIAFWVFLVWESRGKKNV